MLNLLLKMFGSKTDREIKKLFPLVKEINELEASIKPLTDEELKGKTAEFKARLAKGETLDDLLPEAFAAVREAAWRTLGMRHFDVQLIGGIVLHRGAIAEMKTGEGKTLTATLAVYLNALAGRGVHVVTVNDYLAKRDAEWMGRVYEFMGLSVGTILHEKDDQERREAYHCDITYGTNNEMGFDYLRDNMKYHSSRLAQRDFFYAILDEVDSVLIDEARTPLIISGPAEGSVEKYYQANQVIQQLSAEKNHFTVDEKDHHALLTEAGINAAEKILGIGNLYDAANIDILHCLEQSLKAHHLFRKDFDYLIDNNQVVIIDSHTGRKMPGRRYSDGLHQALEAKEGVNIEQANQTLASVTFQNFFRMYEKLSGMTGTAETEATEFINTYKLEVMVIPTNRPLARKDLNDQIYATKAAKHKAIIDEIQKHNKVGRPVLVGTIGIDASEELSQAMRRRDIQHVVLNAKYHERESEIVAQAGRKGAITIATNMAGRGTDIVLGGNPEMLAKAEVANNPKLDFEEVFARKKQLCEQEKKEVIGLGGLCIVGTERHDSRRIDNQLRGRSGRQGDPGSSQFFLAMTDHLMRLFANERMKKVLMRNMEEGVPIEHKLVNRAIQRAQKSVENRNFEARKQLLEYDDVMNKQRTTFYTMRRELLSGYPRDYLFQRSEAIATFLLKDHQAQARETEDSEKRLLDTYRNLFHYSLDSLPKSFEVDEVVGDLINQVRLDYEEKWNSLDIPEDVVSNHERFIMLYMLDQQWKDHMRNMDFLKESVSLRGYGQKDPLIEYKKAGFEMYNELMDRMDEEVVKTLIQLRPRVNDESIDRMRRKRDREAKAMQFGGGDGKESNKPKTIRRSEPKIGRNQPCPCGSGKKFKNCHGRN